MRIAIDAHSAGTQLAGNATYITSMMEALARIDQENDYTVFVTKESAYELYRDRWPNFTVRRTLPHTPLIRIPITLTAELALHPVDILFVQYTAPPFVKTKVVSVIHDISYEHLPETFNRRSRFQMKLTIRHTAKRAAHILAPSEYSRQDIIDTYKIDPTRISTIPLAAPEFYKPIPDADVLKDAKSRYGLPDDYILAVGSIQPRKNLVRLMSAYALLMQKGHDLPPLVLAGKKAWLADETLEGEALKAVKDKVIFTGYVPDCDLPSLYSGAICFVYPSFFEGFGLPPLEAMQCGTPVITGNLTSLPEVVGDAGILVDPYNIEQIAAALERVLGDEQLRSDLSKRGLERASLFTWDRTARQTLDIFEKIATNG
jgi:glycosyltransferase involved in cell wall biosynthesis